MSNVGNLSNVNDIISNENTPPPAGTVNNVTDAVDIEPTKRKRRRKAAPSEWIRNRYRKFRELGKLSITHHR